MASIVIDLTQYPPLNNFALYSVNKLQGNNNTINVNSGYYGCYKYQINQTTGNYVISGSPQGEITNSTLNHTTDLLNVNTQININAPSQNPGVLTNYVINNIINNGSYSRYNLNNTYFSGDTITFTPVNSSSKYYYSLSNPSEVLSFWGANLVFNGQGDPNSQFLIIIPYINFKGDYNNSNTPVTFTLLKGAKASNIFWYGYVGSVVYSLGSFYQFDQYHTDINIPGIFILGNDGNTNGIYIDGYPTFNGNIYSTGSIVFSSNNLSKSITINSQYGNPVCYMKGTKILTNMGYIPIEKLKEGNKIMVNRRIYNNKFTKEDDEASFEPILWISKFKVENLSKKTRPICIEKDAFGKNQPFEDLYVSRNHGIVVDNVLIPSHKLINNKTIYEDKTLSEVVYYHIELKKHSSIVANGVYSESYLDTNNRSIFEKGAPKVPTATKAIKN
jgi:hypothetical protein